MLGPAVAPPDPFVDGDRPEADRPAYGRRGRMTSGQRDRFSVLYGRLGTPTAADVVAYAPDVLEIGFGAGESLVELAAASPDRRVLGVEVFEPGVLALLRDVDARGLMNLRAARTNVTSLLPALPDATFELVRVLFPDPWPKRRHADRRLLREPTLAQLARVLAPGGVLHVATDITSYAAEVVQAVASLPGRPLEPLQAVPDRAPTRFEARARAAGRTVADLAWVRRGTRRAPTR